MAVDWQSLLAYNLLGTSVREWAWALLVFAATIVILRLILYAVIARLHVWAKRTTTQLDDTIIECLYRLFSWPVMIVAGVWAAIYPITLPEKAVSIISTISIIIVAFYAVRAAIVFIKYGIRQALHAGSKGKEVDEGTLHLMTGLAKAGVWIIAFIFVISNLGYNVSSLVAGLGIGGIAIAFALQNILSDLFASFSIHFDRPFEIGDFIIVGTDMGVVKKVGIKSTRLQALQGQELVISNQELTSTRINNYKKMEKRRIVFTFGVTYETTPAKLEKVKQIVTDIIGKEQRTELDRVHFKQFGDSALIYEVVYYVDTNDYNTYMDIQEDINTRLHEQLAKAKVEMAFPTQTLYIHRPK